MKKTKARGRGDAGATVGPHVIGGRGADRPPGQRVKTRPGYEAVIRFRCPVAMEDFLILEAGKRCVDRSDVAREVFLAGMQTIARRKAK